MIGMRKVVSSTSHSEMPSTPSLKWMPSAATHSLSTDVVPAAPASKSAEHEQRHHEGDERVAKAEAAVQRLLFARHEQAQEAPNSGRNVIEGEQH